MLSGDQSAGSLRTVATPAPTTTQAGDAWTRLLIERFATQGNRFRIVDIDYAKAC
jgi:hypothetical protein